MSYINSDYDLNHISLRVGTDCSGLETPLIALKLLNVDVNHIFSCDNDKIVKDYIINQHNPTYFFDDIFERDHSKLPDIDLYVAGPPCVSWSCYGLREGINNPKGLIFFEVIKTIEIKKPKYFIIENVKGLLFKNNKTAFKSIQTRLNNLSEYHIKYEILNTKDFGVPHHRKRLYIIGSKKEFDLIRPSLKADLNDFINKSLPSNKSVCLIPRRQIVLDEIVKKKNINLKDNWVITVGSSLSFARSYKDLCACITTFSNYYYITSQERFLSIQELYCLQGFPKDYKIDCKYGNHHYRLIGNSMSVNVLYYILVSLLL